MIAAYLNRLGIDVPPPPTLDTLFLIHRRHLERVPYENLSIMLGTPPSVDAAASLQRIGEVGRAGYCFHHNGAMELALRDLGFEVTRRHGQVWTTPEELATPSLNHLVLVVADLPTETNPGGEWWVDTGLGDGFLEPLPLVAGEHRQDGFTYLVEDVRSDGWSFRHDASGSFTGVEVTMRSTDPATVLAAHAELSEPGTGRFSRVVVVQRRYVGGVATLRGCLLTEITPDGVGETVLDTWEAWRAVLDGMHLPFDDLDEEELLALYQRMWAVHLGWVASDRP